MRIRSRIVVLVSSIMLSTGGGAYAQALGHLFSPPPPGLMDIAYYPSTEVLKVRINPEGPMDIPDGVLRTPEGQPGLRGEYFTNMDLQGPPVVVRDDPQIRFDWGAGAPAEGIPVDRFSVRWTGTIGPLADAARLMTLSDDGVRLWIDDVQVIDDWKPHPVKANTASILLEAGRVYRVRLEYFENAFGAVCELRMVQSVKATDALLKLLDADGNEHWRDSLKLGAEGGYGEFTMGKALEGRYTVRALLQDAEGAGLTVDKPLVRRRFPWEGNRLGITDEVFAPFTPIRVEGDVVDVVLRRYRLGGLGLPVSVQAGGNVSAGGLQELLAGPVVLRVNGGAGLEATGGFTRSANHEVVYEGKGAHPAVAVSTRTVMAFDGCMKVELTLGPGTEGESLDALWLDIPLKAGMAPLFHASTTHLRSNPAGHVPAGEGRVWGSDSNRCRWYRWHSTFNAYVWLGAEERGLAWFADNDKNWELDLEANPPCQELIREGDAVILRVNLVQKPVVLDAERKIVFGLMASPAKPMREDWRSVPIAWMGAQYWGSDHDFAARYPRNADLSVLEMVKSLRLGEPFDQNAFMEAYQERNFQPGMPVSRDWATMRNLLGWTANWARGAGMVKPTNAYWEEFYTVSGLHPEVETYKHEWGGDMVWRGWGNIGGVVPSYRDFAVWWADRFIRHGVGLYFDNSFPKANYDPLTSDAYRLPDGRMQPSASIWAHRDYLRRIWVLHRTAADPRMPVIQMIHMTNAGILPYLVWNEANLDLEWKDGDEPAQWKYPADLLRAHALGRQTGNIPLALANIHKHLVKSPEREAFAVRTRSAVFGVHEIAMPSNAMDTQMTAFGYGQADCRVFNYWDKGYPLGVDDPAVKSILLERDGVVFILLCSWNPAAAKVLVTVDPSAVPGFDASAARQVRNVETGETQPLENGTFALELPAYGVRYLALP